MRIDNNRSNFDRLESAKTEAALNGSAPAGRTAHTAGGDQVNLSSGVRLASSAASAAAGAPDIRQDKVDRARALVESGKLGSDPRTLADALIDRALADGE
jgi:flagellar biosynthesis anti-sigma factor FlgM